MSCQRNINKLTENISEHVIMALHIIKKKLSNFYVFFFKKVVC